MSKKSICTVIHNEHKYLEQWIKHHLSLGFDEIYLFEDYGSKPHNDITQKYNNVHLDTLSNYNIENTNEMHNGYMRQLSCYKKFNDEHIGCDEWVAFIDCDEFIILEDGYTLDSLIDGFKNVNGLFLYWKEFGADCQIYETDENLIDRIKNPGVMPKSEKWHSMKCFINYNNFHSSFKDLHYNSNLVNTRGEQTEYRLFLYEKCYINHYFTKSWQEWCNRWILRDESEWGVRTLDMFFEVNPDMENMKEHLHFLAKEWMGENNFNKALNGK